MKKITWRTALVCLALVACTLAGVAVAAVTGQGSQEDPLVTLSYVTKAVDDLKAKLDLEIEARVAQLAGQVEEGIDAVFVSVEVPAGQSLTLNAGAQVILRSGKAASKEGLVDLTDGATLWGDMVENHLYIATKDGQTVSVSEPALFLVQGRYQLS